MEMKFALLENVNKTGLTSLNMTFIGGTAGCAHLL